MRTREPVRNRDRLSGFSLSERLTPLIPTGFPTNCRESEDEVRDAQARVADFDAEVAVVSETVPETTSARAVVSDAVPEAWWAEEIASGVFPQARGLGEVSR